MNITEQQLQGLTPQFAHWEKTKDLIDQLLDITLNYRQSGHPGGSRSKVHILVATLLSGAMRWDIRHPEKRFGDRFVLGAGHTVPLVYCTLAVLNETLRIKHAQTGDPRYAIPGGAERALCWEDLLGFRRRGGLSGHAEMAGKTLFLKFNTGPSGHGGPAAAGEALALKRGGGWREGLLPGGGGGPDPRRCLRDNELGLGPGVGQPLLPDRLERLRHRRSPGQRGGARHPGRLVHRPRLARARRRTGHGLGAGDAGDPGAGARGESRPPSQRRLVQDAQGPRLP